MTISTENAPYIPLFIDAAGKPALVVGGGHVALRKVRMLMYHGLKITVVAPEAIPQLTALAAAGDIQLVLRAFQDRDAQGAFLVFAATDSPAVNAQVEEAANVAGALVNRSDSGQTQVMVPATVHRGNLQIAISTGGASPLLSHNLRLQLEQEFDVSWEEYTGLLAEVRQMIMDTVEDAEKRRKMLAALCNMPLRERIVECGRLEAASVYGELLKSFNGEER